MKETAQLKTNAHNKMRQISFYPFISFIITFLCCVFLYYKNDVVPFGKQSLLYSDLKAQYAPFLILWKNHLLNLDLSDFVSSFTYSNKLGLGKNLMGTIGYYLASPFNILLLFFKESDISLAVEFLVAIKLSLASAFMCLFLERRNKSSEGSNYSFKSRTKLPIALGVTYSFTSYIIAFALNIMWLDGYLLLPLLLYLLEIFIFEKKYRAIIPVLILLFVSHFYIAYMVGIFSFLYLLFRSLELKKTNELELTRKDVLRITGKYILIAVLCGLVSAALLLPVALDTLKNAEPVTNVSINSSVTMFPIQTIVEQLFLGRTGHFEYLMNNTPFVFVSILTTCSVFIYFKSNVFDNRIKIFRLIALGMFFVAFYFRIINVICHAFDTPNWFNHRFSFVIYPLLLIITLEVLVKVREIQNKDIIISSSLLVMLLCVAYFMDSISVSNDSLLWSLGLVILYSAILCLLKKQNWHEQLKDMPKMLPALLVIILIVESSVLNTQLVNQSFFISDLDGKIHSESIERASNLNSGKNLTEPGARGDYEVISDNSCVRDSLWGQASLYVNSNGLSLFNTLSNKNLGRFYKQLGYDVNYNYFLIYYNYMLPSNDAFFSLGNVMSTEEYSLASLNSVSHVVSSENTDVYGEEGVTYYLYNNNKLLPVIFPVDSKADELDFYYLERTVSGKNYFEFNQKWFNSMFPEAFDEDYFIILDEASQSEPIVSDGKAYVDVKSLDEMQTYTKLSDSIGEENISDSMNVATNYVPDNNETPVTIKYKLTIPVSGELYFNISVPKVSYNYIIAVNGQDVIEFGDSYSTVNRLGFFSAGEEVTVEIKASKGLSINDVYFAIFDQEAFNSLFDKIDTSSVTVDRFTNGHIEFTVDTSKLKNNTLILSTIPYEEGWNLYIDGKEAEITTYQNALIAVDAEETGINDGKIHKVELKFCAPGLKVGAICSIIGIFLIVIMILYDKLISNNKSNEPNPKANCSNEAK